MLTFDAFHAHSCVYPHVSTPDLLVYKLPILFNLPSRPLANWPCYLPLPRIHIYSKFRLLLFPYKMDDQVHYSTLYPLEDLLFPLSFKATSEGTVEKPLSISSLHLHSEWTHLQSKPRLFSPPSVGHAQSPTQLCV